MPTTAKEVHVYLDGAIQNISSDRKQSIQPPFYDMVLNNAVGEYICSKFPERSANGKDIESTLKRYTDFSVLKTTKKCTPVFNSNFATFASALKPSNALKLLPNFAVQYLKPFDETVNKTNGNMYRLKITIKDTLIGDSLPHIYFQYKFEGISYPISIDLTSVKNSIGDVKGMFYVYDYILDRIRNYYNLDVKYTTSGDDRIFSILFPYGYSNISGSGSSSITVETTTTVIGLPNTHTDDVLKFSPVSILSSSEIKLALKDYYSLSNLDLNPIAELSEDSVDVYYTDFLPTSIYVDYIRKPRMFDIRTGQIPEIDITKDFLDYAVKELLLILNSPTYDRVAAQTIKNQ